MKRSLQGLRIGLVAGALMLPVYGQSGAADPNGSGSPGAASSSSSGTAQTVPGTDMNSPSRTDRGDHDFNFGWLGFVGSQACLDCAVISARLRYHRYPKHQQYWSERHPLIRPLA